jgi:hypothetical protein
MKTNKNCPSYVQNGSSTPSSPRSSNPSTVASPRAPESSSRSRGQIDIGDHSGNDSDGGNDDDPLDDENDDEDTSAPPQVFSSANAWTLEVIPDKPLPNLSNRSGDVSRLQEYETEKPPFIQYRNLKPGAKNIPSTAELPIDFWRLLWDDSLLSEFEASTNAYAKACLLEQGKSEKFKEVTEEELLRYFGVIVFMGAVKLPCRRKYFARATDKYSTPFLIL